MPPDVEAGLKKRFSWRRQAQDRQAFNNTILPHTTYAGDPYYIGTVYHRYDQPRKGKWSKLDNEKSQTMFDEKSVPGWFGTKYSEEGPYLTYLKRLRYAWPSIGYLAEWMDVTTAPPKLKYLDVPHQLERASRTHAAVIEYDGSGLRTNDLYDDAEALRKKLEPSGTSKLGKDSIQIIVVEDLSRDVIEILGSRFDIDPHCFAGQVADYKWYNTRDPWFEAQQLHLVSRNMPFLQVEYMQPWYFPTELSLKNARRELGTFNVLRRDETDGFASLDLDEPGSDVGLIRSKMSLWIRPNKENEHGIVGPHSGILLVDPTIRAGWPLWGGYLNFSSIPSMSSLTKTLTARPTRAFDDFRQRLSHLTATDLTAVRSDPKVLLRYPLMRVASEWHITIQFARCRLAHVEWEIERPDFLSSNSQGSEGSQRKLNPWRRRLPFLRRMVLRVISQISPDSPPASSAPTINPLTPSTATTSPIATSPTVTGPSPNIRSTSDLTTLLPDLLRISSEIDDLTSHADKILSVAIAMVSIEESRKAIEQNRNVTRLTYIALVFVPLSFVASLFSMSPSLSALGQTFWIYFSVALPVAGILLVIARWGIVVGRLVGWGRKIEGKAFATRAEEHGEDDQDHEDGRMTVRTRGDGWAVAEEEE